MKLFDLSFSILYVHVCMYVCLREKRKRGERERGGESVCVCACLCDTRNTKNTYTIHKHTCVVQESHQDGPEIVVQYKVVKFSSDT